MRLIWCAALSVAAVISATLLAKAASADEWTDRCRIGQSGNEALTFDNHRLLASGQMDGDKALYCVVVRDAQQEYLVRWPVAQFEDVETQQGMLANEIVLAMPPAPTQTELAIGANWTTFQVTVPISNAVPGQPIAHVPPGSVWEIITRLYASLPINGNKIAGGETKVYEPVDLKLTSGRRADGSCYFSHVDLHQAGDDGSISFRLPKSVTAGTGENPPDGIYRLSGKQADIDYRYEGDAAPQPIAAALSITNSDGQQLATIPVVACGPGKGE
ncbi:MAG: hypothetical protein ABWY00_08780 [Dongiaceae bacterium]